MVDKVMDLDRRLGPWSLRVWGLIVNLCANALALYGAAGVVRDGSRLPLLIAGGLITLACVLILALPSRPGGDSETAPLIRKQDVDPGLEPLPGIQEVVSDSEE
jgi:hypothetical protein